MIRGSSCLALIAMAGVTPLAAQADTMARARPMLGCWTVSIGQYSPRPAERGADTANLHPPREIQIDTTPGQGLFEHETRGWLVHPAVAVSPGSWRGLLTLGLADSLDLSWLGGTVSLDVRVRVSHDTARGTISRWYDNGGAFPKAPITLVRITCR